MEKISHKEERIRSIMNGYYSRPEIQQAIFDFAKNREISPRYFEGFGKRPDILQYPTDVQALAKNGATSFHCSEEIWEDPLEISTDMTPAKYNEIRIGWDMIIDIDCPWIDGSRYAAIAIVNVLKKHGINAISAKFSGSKGFHIMVPYEAFPKEVAGKHTKDMFPELPRKLVAYLRHASNEELVKIIPEDLLSDFIKKTNVKKGIKCNTCLEIAKEFEFVKFFCNNCRQGPEQRIEKGDTTEFKCPNCKIPYSSKETIPLYLCEKCNISSIQKPDNFSKSIEADLFEVMGLDLILVSPRHLFRMPYSLHEKTALSSVVIDIEDLEKFDFKDANPAIVKVKDFMPKAIPGEAKEFVMQALDWYHSNMPQEREEKVTGKYAEYKELNLTGLKEEQFPPCIKTILKGVGDGKKRALFALMNLFRSIGMEKELLEKKIYEWNEKNTPPLKKGYITSQLLWAYRRKPIMPPNCKEFYQGIGVCSPDKICESVKNPLNYVVKKNFFANKNPQQKTRKRPSSKKR